MTPTRREILERVASGEISPEEADGLLREEPTEVVREPEPDGEVSTIKLTAGFGALVVEGDPDVTTAEVEGKHTATVEGATLVIRGEQWSDIDPVVVGGFSINMGRRHRHRAKPIRIGEAFGKDHTQLRVRMNPSLSLDARLDAGPLSVNGVAGPIRARSAAGPISIEGFRGPIDLSVNAGAIRATGRLTEGTSRIRSDAGAVRVELDPSSSVRIQAEAALGKVIVPGDDEARRGRRFGSAGEATIGAGDATLRVETAMGSIHVSTGR